MQEFNGIKAELTEHNKVIEIIMEVRHEREISPLFFIYNLGP